MNKGPEIYKELLELRNEAGEKLYHRIFLCTELLRDKAWVESPTGGGGDEGTALDRLEDTCFGDLCGSLSLPCLLEIYRKVPDIKTWKANKFNLARMYAEMKARETVKTPGNPRGRQPRSEEGQQQLIRELRERIKELESENRHLRSVIRRIQKVQETIMGI